jgi:hypothetical protein
MKVLTCINYAEIEVHPKAKYLVFVDPDKADIRDPSIWPSKLLDAIVGTGYMERLDDEAT